MKGIKFILLFALVFLPLGAFASEGGEESGAFSVPLLQEGAIPQGKGDAETMSISDEDYEKIKERLEQAYTNLEEEVDISDCEVYVYNYVDESGAYLYSGIDSDVVEIISSLINERPEFFYADSAYGYTFYGNRVKSLTLTYRYEKEDIPQMKQEIEAAAQEVIALVNSDMTDLEKVLTVHEHFVTNYEYDYSYTIANIYDFFKEKKGVCQAYSLACCYVLRKMGIECEMVTSDYMNHAWNMVCVDNEWYHLDTTYDDPSINGAGDILGYCSHENFLVSDSQIYSNGHSNWSAPYAAESKKYDNADFRSYDSPFIYCGGGWYLANDCKIYSVDLENDTKELFFNPNLKWLDLYNWYKYTGNFNIGGWGEYLIYNSSDKIVALNVTTKQAETIFELPESDEMIVGLTVFSDTVRYKANTDRYSGGGTVYELNLASIFPDEDEENEFSFSSAAVSEGTLTFDFSANEEYAGSCTLYAAGYDSDGSLIFVKSLTNGERTVEVEDAAVYTLFAWNGLIPLCESVKVN